MVAENTKLSLKMHGGQYALHKPNLIAWFDLPMELPIMCLKQILR